MRDASTWDVLTVQNGTTEVTNELDEEVGLLSDQLVPATLLATGLDVGRAQTGAHVSLKPLFGALPAFFDAVAGLAPELPPGLLALLGAGSGGARGRATTAIASSRDVAVQGGVFVEVGLVAVTGLAVTVTIFDVGGIGDPPLRHLRGGLVG